MIELPVWSATIQCSGTTTSNKLFLAETTFILDASFFNSSIDAMFPKSQDTSSWGAMFTFPGSCEGLYSA